MRAGREEGGRGEGGRGGEGRGEGGACAQSDLKELGGGVVVGCCRDWSCRKINKKK